LGTRGTNKQFLCAIKNILFISPIKRAERHRPKEISRQFIRKALSVHPAPPKIQHPRGKALSRETFYAHLSHFEQFRLKNSSKQFMTRRKNQIKALSAGKVQHSAGWLLCTFPIAHFPVYNYAGKA